MNHLAGGKIYETEIARETERHLSGSVRWPSPCARKYACSLQLCTEEYTYIQKTSSRCISRCMAACLPSTRTGLVFDPTPDKEAVRDFDILYSKAFR